MALMGRCSCLGSLGKKVKAGDELLLSYGQAYWDNADLGSSDEEREKASWAAAAVAEVNHEVKDQEDGEAEAEEDELEEDELEEDELGAEDGRDV